MVIARNWPEVIDQGLEFVSPNSSDLAGKAESRKLKNPGVLQGLSRVPVDRNGPHRGV